MALSFKLILSLFVALIVVITAVVAFLPLYFIGTDSIESTVEDVRHGIIRRAVTTVADYYSTTRMDGLDVMQATKNGIMDLEEVMQRVSVNDMTHYLLRRIRAAQNRFSVAQIRISNDYGQDADLRTFAGPGTFFVQYIRNSTFFFEDRNDHGFDNDTTLNGSYPTFPVPANYQHFRPDVSPALSGTPIWSPTTFNFNSVAVKFAVPIYARNGTINGLYWTITVPIALQSFVSNIGLRSSGRAMVVDARANGTVLAVSWGEPVVTLADDWSTFNTKGTTKVMEDLTDPLIKRTLSTYGRETILRGATPMSMTMGDSEKDEVFVDIISVEDTYGLNNRIVVAMPLDDFLGDFYTRRNLVAGILAAAVVVLVAIAIGFALAMTRPLESLGLRMKQTATLQDLGEDDSESFVSEVANMQEAYAQMKLELTRMKSFLPQGIMAQALEQSTSSEAVVEMDILPTSKAAKNPLLGSSASSGGEVNELFAMRAVDTTKLGLDAVNTFTVQDSVVVQITAAYSELPTSSSFSALVSPFLKRIVNLTAKHRGIVELMRPHRIVVSFGARSAVADPAAAALKMAMSLVLSERTPNTEFSVLIDRGQFFVGSCGSDTLRQEAFIGPDLDVLGSLGAVVHSDLRVGFAATGRIASSLIGQCTTVPVDCVQFPNASRVQLHAVIPIVNNNSSSDLSISGSSDNAYLGSIPVIKKAFSAMLNGDYDTPKEKLSELPSSLISTDPGLMQIARDAPVEVVAEVMMRHRIRGVVEVLLAACKQGSKAPYCRVHLGWPHVAPKLDPSTLVPFFDISRAISTEEKRLEAQLGKLDKLKNASDLSFSLPDRSPHATSDALFDMALPSASLTYSVNKGDLASNSKSSIAGPAQMTYLGRWQRSMRLLGEGSYGAVYRALSDNGSVAAMKIIPLKKTNTDVEELRKELVVSAKQRHENLVTFVESEVTEDEMVVVMELMPGGSLEALQTDFGSINLHVARRFATDILRGLAHLHRAGIAHCDIKPQNVLVGVDGVCKLADFGAALTRELADKDTSREDGFTHIRGTPLYMAPEVARGDGATPASDIWSFGVLLHRIISEQFPFNDQQVQEMMKGSHACMGVIGRLDFTSSNSLRNPPKANLRDDIDPAATNMIHRCLHLDPEKRPTCEQLLTDEFLL